MQRRTCSMLHPEAHALRSSQLRMTSPGAAAPAIVAPVTRERGHKNWRPSLSRAGVLGPACATASVLEPRTWLKQQLPFVTFITLEDMSSHLQQSVPLARRCCGAAAAQRSELSHRGWQGAAAPGMWRPPRTVPAARSQVVAPGVMPAGKAGGGSAPGSAKSAA